MALGESPLLGASRWQQEGRFGPSARSPSPSTFLPLQIKYHEEFEKSRMGPSGGEGVEPERRDSQDSSSYRRPQEQQQPPHHIPASAPGEPEACGSRGPETRPAVGWGGCWRGSPCPCTPVPVLTQSLRPHPSRAMGTRGRVCAGSRCVARDPTPPTPPLEYTTPDVHTHTDEPLRSGG